MGDGHMAVLSPWQVVMMRDGQTEGSRLGGERQGEGSRVVSGLWGWKMAECESGRGAGSPRRCRVLGPGARSQGQ